MKTDQRFWRTISSDTLGIILGAIKCCVDWIPIKDCLPESKLLSFISFKVNTVEQQFWYVVHSVLDRHNFFLVYFTSGAQKHFFIEWMQKIWHKTVLGWLLPPTFTLSSSSLSSSVSSSESLKSFVIRSYRSSLSAGHPDCIQCPHRTDVCRSLLVSKYKEIHVPKKERCLWFRPFFSSSAHHSLLVLLG